MLPFNKNFTELEIETILKGFMEYCIINEKDK